MAVQLPPQPWKEGDSFVVDETGLEYTFNGELWVSDGQELDLSQYALTDHPHDDLATKAYVDTELGKKANTHSHPYASSNHTHSGGGAVTLKHGSSTFWESYHGTYGCDKWFAWYRRYDGYKVEATSSRKLHELGMVLFKCNSSGFENKVGQTGLLIGSSRYDTAGNYPTVVMNIWKTTQQLVSGYVNMTFEGTVAWCGDSGQTFSDSPSLYWTWVGDAK